MIQRVDRLIKAKPEAFDFIIEQATKKSIILTVDEKTIEYHRELNKIQNEFFLNKNSYVFMIINNKGEYIQLINEDPEEINGIMNGSIGLVGSIMNEMIRDEFNTISKFDNTIKKYENKFYKNLFNRDDDEEDEKKKKENMKYVCSDMLWHMWDQGFRILDITYPKKIKEPTPKTELLQNYVDNNEDYYESTRRLNKVFKRNKYDPIFYIDGFTWNDNKHYKGGR